MKHEVFEVGFWSRVRYACKAFVSVLFNRPIVVYYDDEEMYARRGGGRYGYRGRSRM